MKKTIIGLCISLTLSACNDTTVQTPPPVKNFVGFTPVGTDSTNAKLHIDLNSVKTVDERVQFTFITALDKGYITQNAQTDCRGNLKAADGTQYREDKTIEKPYAGHNTPIPITTQPEFMALMTQACNKAGMPLQITPPDNAQQATAPNDNKPHPLAESSLYTLETHAGTLEIGRSDFDNPPDSLFLNDTLITQEEGNYLGLHRVFRVNDYDVVLFSSNCGGSGCSTNSFSFLLLKPNSPPKLLNTPEMDGYINEVSTQQNAENITLNLGYTQKKRKLAVLANESLTITLENVPSNQPLDVANCQWLHTDALTACIDYGKENNNCDNPQENFSGAIMRGVNTMSDYPGFTEEGFVQQCQLACEAGKATSYTDFSKAVCFDVSY